tara:strand:- start:619 stop:1971 length:1353 start_codon:yes stop_codon:yes gene_type:complete
MLSPTLHQLEVSNLIINNPMFNILCGQVGSGKTITSVYIANQLKSKHILLITEARLPVFDTSDFEYGVDNITKLSYSKFLVKTKSQKAILTKAKELKASLPVDLDFIILDEVHNIKSYEDSQRGRLFIYFMSLFNIPVLGMTGTLITNNYMEAFSILAMKRLYPYSDPQVVLDLIASDEYKYLNFEVNPFSKYKPKKVSNPRRLEDFSKLVKNNCHYLRKIQLENEIKLYENFYVIETPVKFKKVHAELKREKAIIAPSGIKALVTSNDVLQKMSDGWVDSEILSDWNKYRTVIRPLKLNTLKKILSKTQKTILMTKYILSRDILEKELINYKVFVYTGVSKKNKVLIEDFKSYKGDAILLTTLQAISTGFNLDEARDIIFYSVPYRYTDIIQAYARIDRLNSTQDKTYHWLSTDLEYEVTEKIFKKVVNAKNQFGFGHNTIRKVYKVNN